jgi:four helix bundle protein
LSYAKGSSGELRSQIYIGMEAGYIKQEIGREWVKEAKEISSMLGALIITKKKFIQAKSQK